MKKTSSPHQLLALLPYLALISICAYASAIAFQLGYYSAFDIDLFIINPRVDPTSLSAIGIVIISAFFVTAEILILKKIEKSKTLAPAIISDLLLISGTVAVVVTYFLKLDEIESNLGHNPLNNFIALLTPIIVVVLYVIRAILIRALILDNKSFRDAYIETSFLKPSNTPLKTGRNSRIAIRWTALSIAVLLLVVAIPALIGNQYAVKRHSFTTLIGQNQDEHKSIVIGSTADGYIIKNYSAKKQKFTGEWGIVRDGDLKFSTIQIKSVREQKRAR
jgi:hypothetical protein